MIVKGIQCNSCGDKIYSRARHDMHSCTCRESSIDGGKDYIKTMGSNFKYCEIDIGLVSWSSLYSDWNHDTDKYGTILSEKSMQEIIMYDIYRAIVDGSEEISKLVNSRGSKKAKKAYQTGMYSPAIKLEVLLGPEAIERGKKRYKRIEKRLKQYTESKHSEGDLLLSLFGGESYVK